MKYLLLILTIIATQSSNADIGLVGPAGQTIYFTRKFDQIVIQECKPYTVLGHTRQDASAACPKPGPNEYRRNSGNLPITYFKQIAKEDRFNNINDPILSKSEFDALFYESLSESQVDSLNTEQAKIEKYIEEYGPRNADLARLKQIKATLSEDKLLNSLKPIAESKWDQMIDSLIQDIGALVLKVVKYDTDSRLFSYQILDNAKDKSNDRIYDEMLSSRFDCGLTGALEYRIGDCATALPSLPGVESLELVTSKYPHAIYRDPKSKEFLGFYGNSGKFDEMSGRCNETFSSLFGEPSHWSVISKGAFKYALKHNEAFNYQTYRVGGSARGYPSFPKQMDWIWTADDSLTGKNGIAFDPDKRKFLKIYKDGYGQAICIKD